MDKQFYLPEVDMKMVEEIRSRYPKEAIILGFIGRLIKMDSDEYLEAVARIMMQNKNTIFLACGGRPGEHTEENDAIRSRRQSLF